MSIQDNSEQVKQIINDFSYLDVEPLRTKYHLGKDVRDWSVNGAKLDIEKNLNEEKIAKIDYRPFDTRYTFYTGNSRGFHCYPRKEVMQHFLGRENIGLLIKRQGKQDFSYIFVVDKIAESCMFESAYANNTVCPLYTYSNSKQSSLLGNNKRNFNLNLELVKSLLINIGDYQWVDDHLDKQVADTNIVSPLDILDFIYAVLHAPSYREKYKDFLKSDFPRVPVARDRDSFWKLVALGGRLRRLHLLEDPELQKLSTTYPIRGDNLVERVELRSDRVFINDLQFFGEVPKEAWEFYIGGYQPAQKWLKDRKGKKLNYEDIIHYQKIIKALSETIKIMDEIDLLKI